MAILTRALLIGVALAATNTPAIEPSSQWYAVTLDPPGVTLLDAAKHTVTATIPLDGSPSFVVREPQNRYLFVLLDGWFDIAGKRRKEQSSLAVIDLAERKLVKSIQAGWRASSVESSADGRYLLCFSVGKPEGDDGAEQPATATVVDTRSAEVVRTLTGPLTRRKYSVDKNRPSSTAEARFTDGMEQIVILHYGVAARGGSDIGIPATARFFTLTNSEPAKTLTFQHLGGQAELSRDGRWLYVIDPGNEAIRPKNRRNGVVHVIDMQRAEVISDAPVKYQPSFAQDKDAVWVLCNSPTHYLEGGTAYRFTGAKVSDFATGPVPFAVVRPEGLPGALILSFADIVQVNEDGQRGRRIQFDNYRKAPAKVKTAWKGIPNEVIYAPAADRLIARDGSRSDVAILDLKTESITGVVKVGRGGVRFAKGLGRFGMAMGVAMASAGAFSAAGSSHYIMFIPGSSTRTGMVPDPDGKTAYVLNSDTNDVTVVDIGAAKTAASIAVGGGVQQIFSTPEKRLLCAQGSGHVTLVDTGANKVHLKHDVDAKVLSVTATPDQTHLAVLTSKGIVLLDAAAGKVDANITEVADARLLIGPSK